MVQTNQVLTANRYELNLDLTAINVTDKHALSNFLSTFSGTHYVTPHASSVLCFLLPIRCKFKLNEVQSDIAGAPAPAGSRADVRGAVQGAM